MANILAGPLRELAPLIGCLPKSGGHLGLSGILARQATSVEEAYEEPFVLDAIAEREEWCRITGRAPTAKYHEIHPAITVDFYLFSAPVMNAPTKADNLDERIK